MIDELFSFYGFFQITCFVFLVYYLTTVFKKYVSPFIITSLQQQKEAQEKYQQRYQAAQEHYARAQATLDQEKEESKKLLVKIALWNQVQQAKSGAIKEERIHSQEKVKQYLKLQSNWLTLAHARTTILPEALQLTEKNIKKQFQSSTKQQHFLDELDQFFAQRVS